MSTITANPQITLATMHACQNEAVKARKPNPALPQGAPRGTGYGRRHNGMVGLGARDQILAAAGSQVSGHLSGSWSSREAHDSRRKCLLPFKPITAGTAAQFPEMNEQMRR
jgi:hypothetical protein